MDVKNRGVTGFLHAVVLIPWVIVSAVVCGAACMLIAPFNRRIARSFELVWIRLFLLLAGVRVVVKGKEKLDPSRRYVFISNHQSHIDIPVILGGLRQHVSFLAKKELFAIPFFGWGMYALGHVWIDRENARKAHTSIKQAILRLRKENVSLMLFPEGTRSPDGRIGVFKQGSFLLAQQAGVEVVPLVIRNTSKLLPKHAKLIRSGTVTLTVCDPVTIDETMSKLQISENIRNIIEHNFTD